jgi:hypothetical protein
MAGSEWIRCSDSFYKKFKPRIIKDKKALEILKKKGDYFPTFKDATEWAAKELKLR